MLSCLLAKNTVNVIVFLILNIKWFDILLKSLHIEITKNGEKSILSCLSHLTLSAKPA